VAAKRAVSWRAGSAWSAAARQVTARAAIHRHHWFSRSPHRRPLLESRRSAVGLSAVGSARSGSARSGSAQLGGGVDDEGAGAATTDDDTRQIKARQAVAEVYGEM
jgi:hypothetical protein